MAEPEKVTTFKIFAGNLPDEATAEEVKLLFEEYGTVVECTCLGRTAFIHMEDDIEGKHAIDQLQGRELRGNVIKIQEAKNNEGPSVPTVQLVVKNVSPFVDARGLRNMFKRFGLVMEVELQNGEGHVLLEAIGDIKSAIKEMNGYVIEDMALTVEPAPSPAAAAPTTSYSQSSSPVVKSKKFNSPAKANGQGRGWSKANNRASGYGRYTQNEYDYEYEYDGSEYYNGPPVPPPHVRPSFHAPPERILRDPQNAPFPQRQPGRGRPGPLLFRGAPGGMRPRGPPINMGPRGQLFNMGPRGPPVNMGPRGPMNMGYRGPPPPGGRMFPSPGPGRVSRTPGIRPHMPQRGPPSRVPFSSDLSFNDDQQFYGHDETEDYQEEIFYEDEPLPTQASRQNSANFYPSGANSVPVGGPGRGYASYPSHPVPLMPNLSKRGVARKRFGPPGVGRSRPPKFTALTQEVAPGEKYPVPPEYNPNFRAPLKWQREEVKRKVKRKKKPLVPAELPDYSLPVPDLPRQMLPEGAVLKPFPAPSGSQDTFLGYGMSQMDTAMNHSADGSASDIAHEHSNRGSEIDFTADYPL